MKVWHEQLKDMAREALQGFEMHGVTAVETGVNRELVLTCGGVVHNYSVTVTISLGSGLQRSLEAHTQASMPY